VISFRLVRRNLTKHRMRSLLTIASIVVAVFLICILHSLVVALESGVQGAKRDRLVVQSAVSLFVSLPLSYQGRIVEVAGVESTCKWQWFGGYFQDSSNFFANFAVDPDTLLTVYPEIEIAKGSADEWRADRRGCLIGSMLAQQFGWELGDTIPLISSIFESPTGGAWEFVVRGIYQPKSTAVDGRTMFFHWDYFQKGMEQVFDEAPGAGTFILRTAPGADQTAIMREVEELYANGPQRVNCTTEAAFQAQFVSMMGNIPLLVSAIGTGVAVAIALACVNTMLMAFREQMHDVGILKAIGFGAGRVASLMLAQSLLLCGAGGALGMLLAKGSEPVLMIGLGTMFPGYTVAPHTLLQAAALSLAIGLVAGIVPALRARSLQCVDALRMVD